MQDDGRVWRACCPQGGVLTHCNAGALATGGYGTALGVIRARVEQGKRIHVFADETRPFLQGARLTAWELMADGIPTTVICDNMAASLMRAGKIQAVVVGADRIAANGDFANKIGTYNVAMLAKEHGIPFYLRGAVVDDRSATPTGDAIPIEERAAKEVTHHGGKQLTPARRGHLQSGLRCDSGKVCNRDHHGARGTARALCRIAQRDGAGGALSAVLSHICDKASQIWGTRGCRRYKAENRIRAERAS